MIKLYVRVFDALQCKWFNFVIISETEVKALEVKALEVKALEVINK